MRYPLFIGLRYLRAKRREGFISLITAIATGGVAIGVMTLERRAGGDDRLRGGSARPHPRLHAARRRHRLRRVDADRPGGRGRACAPCPASSRRRRTCRGRRCCRAPADVAGVMLRGVEPEPGGAIDFARHLRGGRIEDLATRHAVRRDDSGADGRAARHHPRQRARAPARRAAVGDPVSVVVAGRHADRGRHGAARCSRFAVVGLFEAGMIEYDSALVYIGAGRRAALLRPRRRGQRHRGPHRRPRPRRRASPRAHRRARLGFPYQVRDWMQMNHNLFAAIQLEKTRLLPRPAAHRAGRRLQHRRDAGHGGDGEAARTSPSSSRWARRGAASPQIFIYQGPGHRRRRHRARQRRSGSRSARCCAATFIPLPHGRVLRRRRCR